MSRARWLVGLAVVCLGCSDGPEYAGLEFDVQSAPPVPVRIESERIEIPVGIAVQVAVEPLSTGEDYSEKAKVTLRPDDADLLAVYATKDEREFVLVGLREGTTCLEVKINRHEKECIDVRVGPSEE